MRFYRLVVIPAWRFHRYITRSKNTREPLTHLMIIATISCNSLSRNEAPWLITARNLFRNGLLRNLFSWAMTSFGHLIKFGIANLQRTWSLLRSYISRLAIPLSSKTKPEGREAGGISLPFSIPC